MLGFLLIPAEVCTHHEQLREHQGKSEPLFLVYRVSSKAPPGLVHYSLSLAGLPRKLNQRCRVFDVTHLVRAQ